MQVPIEIIDLDFDVAKELHGQRCLCWDGRYWFFGTIYYYIDTEYDDVFDDIESSELIKVVPDDNTRIETTVTHIAKLPHVVV